VGGFSTIAGQARIEALFGDRGGAKIVLLGVE
jgi:hypothetical protein